EAVDDLGRRQGKIIQQVAEPNPSVKRLGIAGHRQVVQNGARRLVCMAGVGIVDGDVQLEVIGVDSQLVELIGGNQQVQRQLLVSQVIANQFRQEVLCQMPQCQLLGALDEMAGWQRFDVFQLMLCQQLLVQHNMVLFGLAFAEFLQVSAYQGVQAQVLPLWQNTEQPGTVN